ncbi:snaclec coagulation factor X-activating enzyme light chain 1-like [Periplaneta americana]|uniref:snaclec coagulation factor X-activating enzyme light chain 1-like n=1 Tax=Periplaneta americana TaxID=6978 RepID=UPI0037E8FFD3
MCAPTPSMWVLLLLLLLGTCLCADDSEGDMKKTYVCPSDFVRNGNSCYFFSTHMAAWQEAHFACQDKGSDLARLEKAWEDRNMRSYLNKPELAPLERWIGGIYNWETKRWVWAATGRRLTYQGFSRRSPKEDPTWHCIIMDPKMMYKWGSRSCVHRKHYICERPLEVVMVRDEPKPRRHSRRRHKTRLIDQQ